MLLLQCCYYNAATGYYKRDPPRFRCCTNGYCTNGCFTIQMLQPCPGAGRPGSASDGLSLIRRTGRRAGCRGCRTDASSVPRRAEISTTQQTGLYLQVVTCSMPVNSVNCERCKCQTLETRPPLRGAQAGFLRTKSTSAVRGTVTSMDSTGVIRTQFLDGKTPVQGPCQPGAAPAGLPPFAAGPGTVPEPAASAYDGQQSMGHSGNRSSRRSSHPALQSPWTSEAREECTVERLEVGRCRPFTNSPLHATRSGAHRISR